MIPLEDLKAIASGSAGTWRELAPLARELLRIREMAAEMPSAEDEAYRLVNEYNKRPKNNNVWMGVLEEVIRDAIELIAQVAELNEECARLREFAQHGSNCEFGWGGSKCECGLLDILYRGAKP